ncbi:hypothetical protein ACLQ2R_38515 [Streptosporangium sp. DT93]
MTFTEDELGALDRASAVGPGFPQDLLKPPMTRHVTSDGAEIEPGW